MYDNGMPTIKIADVKEILTAPGGRRATVVKIITDQPGLYGVGCASFGLRPLAVAVAINDYLKPLLLGRDVDRIEDIWQSCYLSSYWRQGPVLNNALSGVDEALWDIKGKRAGMPVYALLGGKAREAVPVYVHASGADYAEVEEQARGLMEQGFRHIRVQMAVPGYATYGSRLAAQKRALNPSQAYTWDPSAYVRMVPGFIEHMRVALGDEVELLHDVHELVPPIQGAWLAKALEPYRLFFLEDLFAPEDVDYYRMVRAQCTTPQAMGELFVNQSEYVNLIRERLIDFVRCHISDIGGLTPARKLAAFCEWMGVRTAWHGPGDVSPVGHAANMHLDLAISNFGIQESTFMTDEVREVFPGAPEVHDGCIWANDQPGLGVDVDEVAAARWPMPPQWTIEGGPGSLRRWDGSITRW